MKSVLKLIIIWFIAINPINAQYDINHYKRLESCLAAAYNGYSEEDPEAVEVMNRILQPIGLPRNFLLVSCDSIENAYAFTDPNNGVRYILYDSQFLIHIEDFSNHWGDIMIIAHEIGHHLCGHTIRRDDNLVLQRKQELEADRFAGHMMFLLGASLEETLEIMPAITFDYDDTTSTHPTLSKRQDAITNGYENAKAFQDLQDQNSEPTAESYFIMAKQSYDNLDYNNAKEIINQSIELNPELAESYFLRSRCNIKLGDYKSSLTDLNTVLTDNPSHVFALSQRGVLLFRVGNQEEGCKDLIKACSLGHELSCRNYQLMCTESN